MKLLQVVVFLLAASCLTLAKGPEMRRAVDLLPDDVDHQLFGERRHLMGSVDDFRKAAEVQLGEYEELLARRQELTQKLKRAVDDGDETLIEVAVSDIHVIQKRLLYRDGVLLKDRAKLFLDSARSAYRNESITEQQYADHLAFFRKVKARMTEPVPPDLRSLLVRARAKLPAYFAVLDLSGPKL